MHACIYENYYSVVLSPYMLPNTLRMHAQAYNILFTAIAIATVDIGDALNSVNR